MRFHVRLREGKKIDIPRNEQYTDAGQLSPTASIALGL